MNTRKPTLKELDNYKKWLLLTTFIENLEATIGEPVTSFSIEGDWQSNDEGGSYCSISSITCNAVIEIMDEDERDDETDEEWMEDRNEGARRILLDWRSFDLLIDLGRPLVEKFDIDEWQEGTLEEPLMMRVIEND